MLLAWHVDRLLKGETMEHAATLVSINHGQDWLAYTPEGCYTGSPGVEAFLRWRKGAELLGAEAFAAQYRKPDAVEKALK